MYQGLGYRGLAGALPMSVSFTNLTSGNNQTLKIGDQWVIEVHGNGNSPVTVTGSRDGVAVAFPAMGQTDANGVFKLSGSVLADQVGRWVETWFVGGAQAGTLIFTIAPAPTPTTNPVVGQVNAPDSITKDDLESAIEQIKQSAPGIPTWAIYGALGLGALVLLGGRR